MYGIKWCKVLTVVGYYKIKSMECPTFSKPSFTCVITCSSYVTAMLLP